MSCAGKGLDLCGIDLTKTDLRNVDSTCLCSQATSLYKYVFFLFFLSSPQHDPLLLALSPTASNPLLIQFISPHLYPCPRPNTPRPPVATQATAPPARNTAPTTLALAPVLLAGSARPLLLRRVRLPLCFLMGESPMLGRLLVVRLLSGRCGLVLWLGHSV